MLLTIIPPPPSSFPRVISRSRMFVPECARAIFNGAQLHGRKFNLIETVIYASPINTLAAKRYNLRSRFHSLSPKFIASSPPANFHGLIIYIDRVSPPLSRRWNKINTIIGIHSNVSFQRTPSSSARFVFRGVKIFRWRV